MTLETQIQELLAQAEPLRALDDDDPRKEPLSAIVDHINGLRELQAKQTMAANIDAYLLTDAKKAELVATVEGADAQPKRGPGRPKKADK